MNTLKVGFYREQINPPLGSNIRGYFHQRLFEGYLDDLEVNAVAVNSGDKTIVLITVDCEACTTEFCDKARKMIADATGVDKDAIFINSTHTHVGTCFGYEDELTNDLDRLYYQTTLQKLVAVVTCAIKDLKPAKMGIGFGRRKELVLTVDI